ncbi:GAF domain-containing protein [Planobispora siamensis]|uniref:GAF domain-containing protein n=1 Tax=Planobispora siamensis TaxID=936338 RepID=A0A8J3WLN5_9ACTN|nr:GAF domain-containing protein [Planobispora siamensis]GIH95494.1 hypothetical protein Psi01_61240 [Planobispora siamensis]
MNIREQSARRVFMELADTFVEGFDLGAFLDTLARRCAGLPGVAACGLLLAGRGGTPAAVGACGEPVRALGWRQLRDREGPGVDCFRSGQPVSCLDLERAAAWWPAFAPAAREAGFAAVHTVPMRLRADVIGAVSLFRQDPGAPAAETLGSAREMIDVATIGLVHERILREKKLLAERLRAQLDGRPRAGVIDRPSF